MAIPEKNKLNVFRIPKHQKNGGKENLIASIKTNGNVLFTEFSQNGDLFCFSDERTFNLVRLNFDSDRIDKIDLILSIDYIKNDDAKWLNFPVVLAKFTFGQKLILLKRNLANNETELLNLANNETELLNLDNMSDFDKKFEQIFDKFGQIENFCVGNVSETICCCRKNGDLDLFEDFDKN
ncbi:hypothetical protein MHBO_004153, partial [Bonamia ostreae]